MFKTIIVLIAFMTTAIAADFDVDFPGVDLNGELRKNFKGFKAHIKKSSYFQPSLNTTPIMDFVMLLTNKSADRNVCYALDYLIKTGGPFGMHRKKATGQESAFLAAAAQIVVEQDNSFKDKTYDAIRPLRIGSAEARHLAKVLEIQRRFVSGEERSNPFHGPLVLPPAAADIPDPLKPDVNKGWELFKGLLRDPNLFREGRLFPDPSNPNPKYNKLKPDPSVPQFLPVSSSWLNDVESLGFLMGVAPDIRGQYIDNLWAQDNPWMEIQHNYVQWWFPLHTVGAGDTVNAPRFLNTTKTIFQSTAEFCTYVQQMMRVSFARKAHFWGHKVLYNLDGTVQLVKLRVAAEENDWEKNWITCTHNYLRMTRFLSALRSVGLTHESDALYSYLKDIYEKDRLYLNIIDRKKRDLEVEKTFGIWMNAAGKKLKPIPE